ncbi:WD40 repeat domain-containing protein [Actinocrispum sp. NPDC049592]|uniref:WD40 repeat domain-containing protein n=1 Tax=Actinocrispum sp. NPDC049592 TaxID=3154835 RepID=UPI003448AA6B
MSHGVTSEDVGSVRVLGTDGDADVRADVTEWLLYCLGKPDGPYVLFLLDICHAGVAVDMQRFLEPSAGRVWVIAAAEPQRSAYSARFTTAVTNVLTGVQEDRDHLDLRPDQRFVPLNILAQRVDAEIKRLSGPHQVVTGTNISLTTDLSELPFFINPWRRRLDSEPDVRHFDQREAGYFLRAAGCLDGMSDFTGRQAGLARLTEWAGGQNVLPASSLHVVTGRAGTGKSALIGVLASTLHPQLAVRARQALRHLAIPRAGTPKWFAAVHARHRDTDDFVKSFASQLFNTNGLTADALVARVERLGEPVVLVVDAMDQAADPAAVCENLILPLARTRNCRILVAVRAGDPVGDKLIPQAGDAVTDLDDVPAAELMEDIRSFVDSLLFQSKYRNQRARTSAMADAVARVLAGPQARPQLGEFLAARLYTQDVIENERLPQDAVAAGELGAKVPTTITGVFELDMRSRKGHELARPVVAALAFARGEGMPAEVVPIVAAACAKAGVVVPDQDVAGVLDEIDGYLTIGQDEAGVAVYRLFHEDLADHVRAHPFGPDDHNAVDEGTVYKALVDTVPKRAGRWLWDRATPYVRRHVLTHACTVEQMADTLSDPDYVLSAYPEPKAAVSELAGHPDVGAMAAAAHAVIVESRSLDRELSEADKMMRLAVTAVRTGGARLAWAITDHLQAACRPVFAATLPPPRRGDQSGPHENPVLLTVDDSQFLQFYDLASPDPRPPVRVSSQATAIEVFKYDGRTEMLVGYRDGTARVLTTGVDARQRLLLTGHLGAVRAVTVGGASEGQQVLMTADDEALQLWDVRTGERLKWLSWGDSRINDLQPIALPHGTDGVIVKSEKYLSVLDLAESASYRVFPLGSGHCHTSRMGSATIAVLWAPDGLMTAVDMVSRVVINRRQGPATQVCAATTVAGTDTTDMTKLVFVTGDRSGNLLVRTLDGVGASTFREMPSGITTLTSCMLNGRPVIVCATRDGKITVLDYPSGSTLKTFQAPLAVRAFGHMISAKPARKPAPRVAAGPGFGGVIVAAGAGHGRLNLHHVPLSGGPATIHVDAGRPLAEVVVLSRDTWAVVRAKDEDGGVHLWHPLTGTELGGAPADLDWGEPLQGKQFTVRDDGLVVLNGQADGTVHVHVLSEHGTREHTIEAHSGAVKVVSALGDVALSLGDDSEISFWDLPSLRKVGSLALPGLRGVVAIPPRGFVVETADDVVVFRYMSGEDA